MRFLVVAALVVVGLSAAFAAPGDEGAPDLLSASQRAWLAAHPRIVLGAADDWAPWVAKDANGVVRGLAVDHMALINRKLGTDIRIEAGPWPEMVAKAEAGAIDGLTLTAPIPERQARFAFTEPFFTDHDFFFLRTEDLERRQPARLEDLKGKRVGYAKDTLRIGRVLKARPDITAVAADGYDDLARRLLTGEIDAAIASYSFEYWRASHGVQGFSPTRIVRETDARLVMSIRRDRAELAGIIDAGLRAIRKEDVEALYARWFGADHLRRLASFAAVFTPAERAWLAQHPVLRVAVDAQRAPVEFFDRDGVPRGMSLAYLDRIGGFLGTRFEVVPGASRSDATQRLAERDVDLLPAIAASAQRTQRMHFTEPYLSFPAAIFSAADVAYLGNLEALRGRTVAVVHGEALEPWLRSERPDLDLMPVEDTRAGLRAVADGKAYAFVGNLVTTSYYIGQSGLTQIKIAGETPFVYRLGMAVRDDWPILAGILQKGIDAIPVAEREAIYRDWIAIRYEHSIDYSLLWKGLAAAALVLLLVFAERTYWLNRANARLRHLARDVSLAEERERRRLAGELHDSPMQKLALAQMQFGALGRDPASESGERLETGLGLMREAIDELRSLQFELSPPMLYREGLAPALRWLASRATERTDVEFSFCGTEGAERLPQDLAVFLYQCARELVYNAARHAAARVCTIELAVDAGQAVLTVTDDGAGFAPVPREQGRAGGFGLFSIRERLALFGGELSIGSDGTGTRARIAMPMRRFVERDRARADEEAAHRQPSSSGASS
jgi:signal transduction histidine kinase